MMKFIYPTLFILITFCSCSVSLGKKEKRDRSMASYLLKNKERLRDAVAFSLVYSLDKSIREFSVGEINDKKKRELLADFGAQVNVFYDMYDDVYDSTVTFKVINLSGVQEIIYSFAVRPLERMPYSDGKNALVRVTENIYYARRPFPLM